MKITWNVEVEWRGGSNSVLERAWKRWLRDVDMTLLSAQGAPCRFEIEVTERVERENYLIRVEPDKVVILAGDELGVIYALLFLSEKFLGVKPFWFWNDQSFRKIPFAVIPEGEYRSPVYQLRFRGWFINDEVLLDAWGRDCYCAETGITENKAFEMAMEALLRLGGNMVIPGTDKNSHKYRALAADMGLWITHHHAEPLGAAMFARVYPELTPSYRQYPELFHSLWREAVKEQKSCKVIWNIGFRGQGDRPFWEDDPEYDTPEKRGALISSLIRKQYDLLCEYIKEPVCCTNLYGEVMELYKQGFIDLPEHVIYIWADNGYGKMTSRRQGNHNPRVAALPEKPQGRHGVYYHASFYDLQAASHITMLPNSTAFVARELGNAMEKGVRELIIVNCSNVKPHTYMLDTIARVWGKEQPAYTELYFPHYSERTEELYQRYFEAMLRYGEHEDDHAGEQYYHYTMRAVCHGWLAGRVEEAETDLVWLTGKISLRKQVEWLEEKASGALPKMEAYYHACAALFEEMEEKQELVQERQLVFDSLLLQAAIHYKSLCAQKRLCCAFMDSMAGRQEAAFVGLGRAVEYILEATDAMEKACHGKWKGFYDNDCLTDVKFTGYMLKQLMGYVRNLGDGPHFYKWALRYQNTDEDQRVVLITNMRNHPTDWEMYLSMKESEGKGRGAG